jgi:hypothetical protein
VDVSGAGFYQTLLEAVYTGIEALDTSPFRWDASDRFRQARYLDPTRGGSKHLEVWLDLGACEGSPGLLRHQSAAVITHRYTPEDDSMSQARIHAATRAVSDWLEAFRGPNGCRFRPTGYTLQAVSAEWVETRLTFDSRIPRSA